MFCGAWWPIAGVRLRVDLGLLPIVLLSMAIGRPFTLQYAREMTERAVWVWPGVPAEQLPGYGGVGGAILVMVLADC